MPTDEHGRAGEAELVRMQWRPPDRTVLDPAAFSSHWLSHEPRAVQLRLRDVSPLMEPARRALIARPAILCPKQRACTARWEHLRLDERSDLLRHCAACESAVEFCTTFDDIQERSRRQLPIAVDPGLVAERARLSYQFPYRDFEPPTNPWNPPQGGGDDD